MKKLIIVLISILFSIPAYAKFGKITTTTDPVLGPIRHAKSLDANISLQYGKERGAKYSGNIQLRAGYLYFSEPSILSIGVISQFSSRFPASYGIEFEATNLWEGYRGHLGFMLDVEKHPIVLIGVGFSIVGVEVQTRKYSRDDMRLAFFAKINIPIGIILLDMMN